MARPWWWTGGMPFRGDVAPQPEQQFEHPCRAAVEQRGGDQRRPAGAGRGKEMLQRPVQGRHKARGMGRPVEREGKAKQQVETFSQGRHFFLPFKQGTGAGRFSSQWKLSAIFSTPLRRLISEISPPASTMSSRVPAVWTRIGLAKCSPQRQLRTSL